MFRHILLPVDGSLSMEGVVRKCLAFAAGIDAAVLAVHVLSTDASGAAGGEGGERASAKPPSASAIARGQCILDYVAAEATLLGVRCERKLLEGPEPWRAIIACARDTRCDLICMGSHGRRGASEHVLASQAAAVLAHTQLPVLLYR